MALLLDEDDVAEPELVETLVRAQQVSGADVVTCGISVDGTTRTCFPGEPRALGLLANGYGTVGLVRRSLLDGGSAKPSWPLLAQLSVSGGAQIVSVPLPLVTSRTRRRRSQTHPAAGAAGAEALRACAAARTSGFLAELVTRRRRGARANVPVAARPASHGARPAPPGRA